MRGYFQNGMPLSGPKGPESRLRIYFYYILVILIIYRFAVMIRRLDAPSPMSAPTHQAPSLPSSPSKKVPPSFYKRILPEPSIAFSSPEGKRVFREALSDGTMQCYFRLAEQFVTQVRSHNHSTADSLACRLALNTQAA